MPNNQHVPDNFGTKYNITYAQSVLDYMKRVDINNANHRAFNQTKNMMERRAISGGGLDGKDLFGIALGAAGFYNDVKGNALHNDLYWKGKTTGKIYTKNPFTITKVGWKANSFKATGKAF